MEHILNNTSFSDKARGHSPFGLTESRRTLYTWLEKMPTQSIDRLRHINMSTTGSHHVILTLAYGLYDGHIRKVNRLITSLLLARMRAERQGNEGLVGRINSFMHDLHQAIDITTGTTALRKSSSSTCVRTGRTQEMIAH